MEGYEEYPVKKKADLGVLLLTSGPVEHFRCLKVQHLLPFEGSAVSLVIEHSVCGSWFSCHWNLEYCFAYFSTSVSGCVFIWTREHAGACRSSLGLYQTGVDFTGENKA